MKWLILVSISVIGLGLFFVRRTTNNVCKTFGDYYTNIDQNENCYYNPDAELTVPQVIERWGYPVESHNVTTEDGFILTMFRIPYSKNSPNKTPGTPIYLQHGYKANSKCFITTGRKSLGFILSDQGYDVWLGNFRGSDYGRHHITLSPKDEQFWNYTFHEHGVYDVPAQAIYVSDVTNQKIIYLGYSMGATAGTIFSTEKPKTAEEKIKIMILMAPFIYPIDISLFTQLGLTIWPIITPIVQFITNGQYYPDEFRYINNELWKRLCYPYPIQMQVCQFFDQWATGFDYQQNDPETIPVTLLHFSETSSVKLVHHLSQMFHSRKFRQFDYDSQGNEKMYGNVEPPMYNISNMRVPVHVLRANNDLTCTKEGINQFFGTLPKNVKQHDMFIVSNSNFNHVDFVFAKDVIPLVYDHLVKFINSL